MSSDRFRRRGQWLLVIHAPVGHNLPERILTQILVIVEVFPATGNAHHTLGDHGALLMLDTIRIARIGDAGGYTLHLIQPLIHFPQLYCPGIRGDLAAVEFQH